MEELREKAKKSISLKKPSVENGSQKENYPNSPKYSSPIAKETQDDSHADRKEEGNIGDKREVSETIPKINDSERSSSKQVKHSRSHRSGSSRHRRSSRHEKSRHRDSSRRSKKKHRRSSSKRSSSSRERRKRRKESRRKRRSISSSSSRGRHRDSKYSSRRRRRHKSSDSSSLSSNSEKKDKDSSKVVSHKSSHPYFSRLSKIRRDRLHKQKQERFWDGFQWVSKESIALASKDPTAYLKNKDPMDEEAKNEIKIVTGKDLRRVVATNLPLDYGMNQEDLANYIILQ